MSKKQTVKMTKQIWQRDNLQKGKKQLMKFRDSVNKLKSRLGILFEERVNDRCEEKKQMNSNSYR